jgi:hypothetical protein
MSGVVASTPSTGKMTISINGENIEVDSFATERILVTV